MTSSVLIIGNDNKISKALRQRLKRENYSTYTVSSDQSENHVASSRHFFIDYKSSSIYDVMLCCKPDVVIFTAAFDHEISWEKNLAENETFLDYISSVSNVIRYAEIVNAKRFIYLSAGDVFDKGFELAISESFTPNAAGIKGTSLHAGEILTEKLCSVSDMQRVVLRINDLYSVPENRGDCTEIISELCLSAFCNQRITINDSVFSAPIFNSDVAQAVLLLMEADSISLPVYQIRGEVVSEKQLADCINSVIPCQVTLSELDTQGLRILDDYAFSDEFGFKPIRSVNDTIPMILDYMKKHKNDFMDSGNKHKNKHWLLKMLQAALPYIESVGGVLVAVGLDRYFCDSPVSQKLDFFLLYIILFALMHGLYLAVFSSVLSLAATIVIALLQQSLQSSIGDIYLYIWFCQLFIVGMSIGYLRDEFKRVTAEKQNEKNYYENKLEEIVRIEEETDRLKEYFEVQVLNNKQGFEQFYAIVDRLEATTREEVSFEAVQIFSEMMETDSVALYISASNGFYRLLANTSTKVLEHGMSINKENYGPVFEQFLSGQIYVNNERNNDYPDMALSVSNPESTNEIVIFLWDIPFTKMTLHGKNTCRILGMLTQNALVRSLKYYNFTHGDSQGDILSFEEYTEFRNIYRVAEEKGLVHTVEIEVSLSEKTGISEADSLISSKLRKSDMVTRVDDSHYRIMLINAFESSIANITERFMKDGLVAEIYREDEEL